MKVLLVEDEAHKRDEISLCVQKAYGVNPEFVDSVRSAVIAVITYDYDLIILDMALPTFSSSSTARNKGHDQAQGGIEVLRTLSANDKQSKILIITQYPDFYIGTDKIKLKDAPKIISSKYQQLVCGAVLYQYKSEPTQQKIVALLRTIR